MNAILTLLSSSNASLNNRSMNACIATSTNQLFKTQNISLDPSVRVPVPCPLTGVAGLTVDALLWGAAHGPVPVHKEAVSQRVTEPLHGGGHASTGRQTRLPCAAQEHALRVGEDRRLNDRGCSCCTLCHFRIFIRKI